MARAMPVLPAPGLAAALVLCAALAIASAHWALGLPALALGGALFMLSDALLAANKFAAPLPLASLWILSTYWAAQWCIASWLSPALLRKAGSPPAR